ncbi:MAG: phosphoglycerate mutase [Rhodoferax sp.]|nr:phosphoglycerate mutase [Rhodoferax sp.]
MHTLITYAAPPGPHCRDALNRLELPYLAQLLATLSPTGHLQGTAADLTPLPERIQSMAAGLDGADGLIPWAGLEARQRGLTGLHGPAGWAWVTPCHWKIHADHVEMSDPVHLALTPHDADQLLIAMQPFFAEDGITLFAPAAGQTHSRWLAHGAVFVDLPTASLDRVSGQSVDAWMPRQEQAKSLRRLQNEMQMLLYTHLVNDQRAHFKLPAVNAFWVSGTGSMGDASQAVSTTMPSLRDALRLPALKDDAADWVMAWRALDNSTLKHDAQRLQQGEIVQLTLCSDTQAITLTREPLTLWQRLQRRVTPLSPREFLTSLC